MQEGRTSCRMGRGVSATEVTRAHAGSRGQSDAVLPEPADAQPARCVSSLAGRASGGLLSPSFLTSVSPASAERKTIRPHVWDLALLCVPGCLLTAVVDRAVLCP